METESNAPARAGLPLGPEVRIAAESQGLIALDKPSGVRSHPNKGGGIDAQALIAAPYDLKAECYDLPGGGQLHLLNRLDGPTSGLILLTADAALARVVKQLFAQHKVRKTYHALVFGQAGRLKQEWRDRMRVQKRGGSLRAALGGGDPALTSVRGLQEGSGALKLTLLELQPHTGRTHQLRVQCAGRHLPIVGDATYGDFALNKKAKQLGIKRLCLHSAAVSLQCDFQGRKLSFSAKSATPEEFLKAL